MASTSCPGFKAAGIAAGIKKNHDKDLGIIYSEIPATAAGVFTRNLVQAAPVVLDRKRIRSGRGQAIVVNSGNANCCTGEKGRRDAEAMARLTAQQLGLSADLVLVASTGVIGQPLPMERIQEAIPISAAALKSDGFIDFAEAILTTDTVPKAVFRRATLDSRPYCVLGMAKGAGMIRPDMATLLCFVVTDADVDAGLLQDALAQSVDGSFNRITIDGDTSTNDTALILANGVSGVQVKTRAQRDQFQAVLDAVLMELARGLVKDGEGVTKLVEIRVKGAGNARDARRVADTIAHSNLVKTAFFGEDANWGRIMAAAGRAGVALAPGHIDIFFDDLAMVVNGLGMGQAAEAKATRVLKKDGFTVTVDLKQGDASASVLTCDFSVDYVKINADYRS